MSIKYTNFNSLTSIILTINKSLPNLVARILPLSKANYSKLLVGIFEDCMPHMRTYVLNDTKGLI